MQRVFYEVGSLDKRCYEEFFLSEDLLMEQAATALANEVRKRAKRGDKILFVCGTGNNGADGISAARMLKGKFETYIYLPLGVKSSMAKLQLKRAEALCVELVNELIEASVYVDALFGSGLKRELSEEISSLVDEINQKEGIKIACDIPTGLDCTGSVKKSCFRADITVTMGALKEALFSDIAKDFCGDIKVANLGVSRESYEGNSNTYLLERSDLALPFRDKEFANKGSFGHVSVIAGEKKGASILCATGAFNLGAGLVSLVSKESLQIPPFLMNSRTILKNSKVVVAGMGLGDDYSDDELRELFKDKQLVIDADMFYKELVLEVLEKQSILTPHPKEFSSLLEICGFGKFSVNEILDNRFELVREFCKKYPKVVLLLKGANTLIAQNEKVYINSLGSSILAKGGSGDVLAGFIGALLANGYTPLNSAINASLAHSLSVKRLKINNYALNPLDICESVKWL